MSDERRNSNESEDDDEELDPRVQSELEKLNVAADGVNHLETEYTEAQAMFNRMHSEAGIQLRYLKQKLGKSVERARPYYDTLRKARQAKIALHHAAMDFENAQSKHDLARKKVTEAETRAFSSDGKINFAMQDMLNQANMEVTQAARVKSECWKSHQLTAQVFEEEQKRLTDLSKALTKVITKSRPYFELKMTLNRQLEEQKQRIENIHTGIKVAKKEYNGTLLRLEKISNEIHHMRRMRKLNEKFATPRERGVGAESTSEDEGREIREGGAHSANSMDVKIKDFDEISAFGDDSDSLAGSEYLPAGPSRSCISLPNSPQSVTNTCDYDVIFSKDVDIPPALPDHLAEEVLFNTETRLFPNIIKRWKSMTSIEGRSGEFRHEGDKEKITRTSSHSFALLPALFGKSRDRSQSVDVSPTGERDSYNDYDIIDGKIVPLAKSAIKGSQSSSEDERYPGEGCDSNSLSKDGDNNLETSEDTSSSTLSTVESKSQHLVKAASEIS